MQIEQRNFPSSSGRTFATSTEGDLSSSRGLFPDTDPLPTELAGDSRSFVIAVKSPSGVGGRPGGGGSPSGPNGDGNPKGNEAAAAASDPGARPGYKSAMLMGKPVNSRILG